MMNPLKRIQVALSAMMIMTSFILGIAAFQSPLYAEAETEFEILKCQLIIKSREYRCLVRVKVRDTPEKGTQVFLYDQRQNWVATGDILTTGNQFFVARFQDSGTPLYKDLILKLDSGGDELPQGWSDSFGKQ